MKVPDPPRSGLPKPILAYLKVLADAAQTIQGVKGRNISFTEHRGKGTAYHASRKGDAGDFPPPPPTLGACCYDDGTCDDLTEADCTDAEGNWQGLDTTCDDDPNPCVGACCIGGDCFDGMTKADCETAGGTFQDFQSTCDDPDIDCSPPLPPCNGCGFAAFDGSGRMFRTSTDDQHQFQEQSCLGAATCQNGIDGHFIHRYSYDEMCNLTTEVIPPDGQLPYHPCDGSTFLDGLGIDCSPVIISPTVKYCYQDFSGSCCDPSCTPPSPARYAEHTITLSDECNPEGFSPPP